MKLSKHFDLKELVNPDIYAKFGDRSADFINPTLPETLEELRLNIANKIKVNDWHLGGNYKDSGLRMPLIIPDKPEILAILNSNYDFEDTYSMLVKSFKGVGAQLSTHKQGVTADCKFETMTPREVYYHILNNQKKYPYIIRMENIDYTDGWLHIECGSKRHGDIIIFNP